MQNFLYAAGKGTAKRDIAYILSLIAFYNKLGATDIIPTTDQLLFTPAINSKHAESLNEVFEYAKSHDIKFFYGNGVEAGRIAQMMHQSLHGPEKDIYKKFLSNFFKTAGYLYYPYESQDALIGSNKTLRKLRGGIAAYRSAFLETNNFAASIGKQIEIGTNIIFNPEDGKEEIFAYYNFMDKFIADFPNLNIRFNGFHLIPSNCAPHIDELKNKYVLYSEDHPELKILSIPQIMLHRESFIELEKRLAFTLEATLKSKTSRTIYNKGTYGVKRN